MYILHTYIYICIYIYIYGYTYWDNLMRLARGLTSLRIVRGGCVVLAMGNSATIGGGWRRRTRRRSSRRRRRRRRSSGTRRSGRHGRTRRSRRHERARRSHAGLLTGVHRAHASEWLEIHRTRICVAWSTRQNPGILCSNSNCFTTTTTRCKRLRQQTHQLPN